MHGVFYRWFFSLIFFHSRTAEGKYCLYPTREQGEREACVPRRLTPVFLAIDVKKIRNKIIWTTPKFISMETKV